MAMRVSRQRIHDPDQCRQFAEHVDQERILREGGTVDGWALWLFRYKRSFELRHRDFYVSLYLNLLRARKKRGGDLDAETRAYAARLLEARRISAEKKQRRCAWLGDYCRDNAGARSVIEAVAMLTLGLGLSLVGSEGGEDVVTPNSATLDSLLLVFAQFDGPPTWYNDDEAYASVVEVLSKARGSAHRLLQRARSTQDLTEWDVKLVDSMVCQSSKSRKVFTFLERAADERAFRERIKAHPVAVGQVPPPMGRRGRNC